MTPTLELGIGMDTPGIIKYPFWKLTLYNRKSTYACINLTEAYAPTQIASRSICIGANVGSALADLLGDRQLMKAQWKRSVHLPFRGNEDMEAHRAKRDGP